MRRLATVFAALALAALLAGCATTTHTASAPPPTWRAPAPATATEPLADGPLAVYAAAFGLASSVADRWPALAEARVGFGVAQRIADALYDSGRFAFREEKAEVAARLTDLLARRAAGAEGPGEAVPPGVEAGWVLYGEVVDVQVERRESVRGLAGRTEVETRVAVRLRLLERASGRFTPATATGVATGPLSENELDPVAVAEATGDGVRRAAEALLARLEGGAVGDRR